MRISGLIIVLVALWYTKTTSLPKLFYRLQDRRDVEIRRLRKLEKSGIKVTKLLLDIKYFENFWSWMCFPNSLTFKPPSLPPYKKSEECSPESDY